MAGLVMVPDIAFAKGTVTGRVVNKDTGEPMDYVTVQVLDTKTNKPLNISVMTDENGAFTLPGLSDGSYLVKVMNVGSIDQTRPAEVKGADIDLGTIRLADDHKEIGRAHV